MKFYKESHDSIVSRCSDIDYTKTTQDECQECRSFPSLESENTHSSECVFSFK